MKHYLFFLILLFSVSYAYSQKIDSTAICKCEKNEIYSILCYFEDKEYDKIKSEIGSAKKKYDDFPLVKNLILTVEWNDKSDVYFEKAKELYKLYCKNKPKDNETEFNAFVNDSILECIKDPFIGPPKYESKCLSRIFENLKYYGNCYEIRYELDTYEQKMNLLDKENSDMKKDTTELGIKKQELESKLIEANKKYLLLDSTIKHYEKFFRECIKMDSTNNEIFGVVVSKKSFNKFATEFIKDSIHAKNEKIKQLSKKHDDQQKEIRISNSYKNRIEKLNKDSIDKVYYLKQNEKLNKDMSDLKKDTLNKRDKIIEIEKKLSDCESKAKEQGESILNLTNRISTLSFGHLIDNEDLKQVFRIDTVLFEKGSFNISRSYYQQLDSLSKIIRDDNDVTAYIVGYADSDGTDVYNLVISELRAKSILLYFHKNAISWDQIKILGFGEIDKKMNERKVEIYLLK